MQYTSFDSTVSGRFIGPGNRSTRVGTAQFLQIFSWSGGFGLPPYLTTKYAIEHMF